MQAQRRILLVEDDPEIGNVVAQLLRELGWDVQWVRDGAAALHHFKAEPYDLIILDILLPGLNGFEVCRRIREYNRFTPILMLTAKTDMRDVVLGLEMGADEYVKKPFATPELVARINALFRRIDADRENTSGQQADQPIQRGALTVFPTRRRVMLEGAPVPLTSKEFDLLLLLVRNPGRTFSRSELLNQIWGHDFDGHDHTVNTHINRLRSKIEQDSSKPMYVQTAWGVGYRFADIDELEAIGR